MTTKEFYEMLMQAYEFGWEDGEQGKVNDPQDAASDVIINFTENGGALLIWEDNDEDSTVGAQEGTK